MAACFLLLLARFDSTGIAQEAAQSAKPQVQFVGSIVDVDTKQLVAARVYLQDSKGNWLFVRSASEQGTAWPYSEAWVPMPNSVERHTTVSAHPFTIDLAPGEYQVLIERGKEYLPLEEKLIIAEVKASTGSKDAPLTKLPTRVNV